MNTLTARLKGNPLAEQLRKRIEARTARVAVVGLGYVGLPLAETFAWGGYPVIGFDIDGQKVARLRRGESYIGHICAERVAELNASGRFDATDDPARFVEADAIVICVPTPLGDAREPDLSFIESTGRTLMPHLRQGQLVVLESSTYPGTTEEVLQPILEESGLKAGTDFFLAYSPEREDPGNKDFATRNIPKVVGGLDEASLKLAVGLYEPIVDGVVPVTSIKVAEAAKILENTYRAVNIALVNELKAVFTRMGIDVWEVIAAAKTKPFGFQAFYPGPGLGGHCIPIDPFYLTWAARRLGLNTRFIELAGEVNTAMPQFVIDRLAEALNDDGKPVKGSRVCVLGVAYKKDVDDPRESPAFEILEKLQERGAVLSYSDPHVSQLPRMRHHPDLRMTSSPLTAEFLAGQDAVLIVTDHSRFDYDHVVAHARLVVDTRNATAGCKAARARIVKA
ncbi:MAG: nucleotide sugar dehydrogenase [Gemmataceae bacterium]